MPSLGIAPAPRRCARQIVMRTQGRRRFRASFRREPSFTFWRLGFRQSSFNHIARAFPAPRPYALARPLVSWHAIVPFTFRILSKPSGPGISSESLPAEPGIQQGASRRSDFLGLLAQRVQPGDPVQVVLPGRVALLRAHLHPQASDLAGGLFAQVGEIGLRVADRTVAGGPPPLPMLLGDRPWSAASCQNTLAATPKGRAGIAAVCQSLGRDELRHAFKLRVHAAWMTDSLPSDERS